MQNLSCSVIGALCVLGAGFGMAATAKISGFGRKWLLLLALMGCPVLLHAQPAATYYVAPTGSDTNPGTYALPFATINKAVSVCNGGETVAVYSGTYSTVFLSNGQYALVADTKSTRTSMVTVFGWGPTQPLLSVPSGTKYYAIYENGACFVTYENLEMRSENNSPLVVVSWSYGPHTPDSHDITIEDCDLSNPDTADPAQTSGNPDIMIGYGSSNVTVEDCNIHDSETGIGGPGEPAGPAQCNNINLLDNTLNNFTGDAIQFGSWNNVTVDGNVITNIADAPGSTFHNDGCQFTGNTEGATITHNYIAHSHGQLLFIQPAVGPIDNVLVEDNVLWDSGAYACQSQDITNAKFINNTIFQSYYGGLLLRSYASVAAHDTIVANNSLCGFSYAEGATSAYEDYNYLPTGQGTGAHDIFGTNPSYVNTSAGNFHPASGSPLLAAGVHSFTVSGNTYYAPTDDLDFITRGNPPTIGAYETTLGNYTMAYSGFDYSTTGHVGSLTDGAADFGWTQTTWSGNDSVVSPGLTYENLPVLGYALSFGSNVSSDRTINPSTFPAGYGVVGSDGVTRLGAAGTTVWVSFLLDPTENDPTNTLNCGVNLTGQTTDGTVKLTIGDIGTNGAGNWAISDPAYGGGYAVSSVPIAQNTTTFLVAEIQFVAGSNNDVVNLWVNPPLGKTPPATPTVTLTGHDILPFGVAEFKGTRTATGDEFSIGTTWLSVTSGGNAGL